MPYKHIFLSVVLLRHVIFNTISQCNISLSVINDLKEKEQLEKMEKQFNTCKFHINICIYSGFNF